MSSSLLALLQLSESGFPSGAFTHSYGLEQAVNEGWLADASEIEAFVRSVIAQSAATGDARACHAACGAGGLDDITSVIEIDGALWRSKAAAELRQACVQTGRRFIEETTVHLEAPILRSYAASVAAGEAPGCHAVAFGVVAADLGVAPADAAAALLSSTANTLLQAAMRLGRISHRDAQAALHRLRPLMAERAAELMSGAASRETDSPLTLTLPLQGEGIGGALRSFHPLQEIASMRHQHAEARLFAS